MRMSIRLDHTRRLFNGSITTDRPDITESALLLPWAGSNMKVVPILNDLDNLEVTTIVIRLKKYCALG